MSSTTCSNFHVLFITFFFLLTMSSLYRSVPSLLSSCPLSFCSQKVSSLFPSCFLFPFDPRSKRIASSISHIAVVFEPRCQAFALSITFSHPFFPFRQRTVPSVTAQHPRSTPLTPSLWWLIPSVTRLSHTFTKPSHFHQSVNPFKKESGFSLCWCDCEVRPEREGRRGKKEALSE